jgi:hypothetical protein
MKLFEPQVMMICCGPVFLLALVIVLVIVLFSRSRHNAPGPNMQSPAATPSAMVPAGWQPDPSGRHQLRYWDGMGWSAAVSDNGQVGSDAL